MSKGIDALKKRNIATVEGKDLENDKDKPEDDNKIKRQQRKLRPKKKTVAVNLQTDLVDRLQKYADDHACSVSAIVGFSIAFYLEWMDIYGKPSIANKAKDI